MNIIGIVVISVVMCCAVAGALASLFDSEQGLGKEFLDGLHAIGYIFVPVAGVMAAIPLLSRLVRAVAGPVRRPHSSRWTWAVISSPAA